MDKNEKFNRPEEGLKMNSYEQKRQDRIDRYKDWAQKARGESESLHGEAHRMASVIPFGQPILVGHHSERSDRNFRNRIHNKMEKSFEASKKAEHYEDKAKAAESNRSISSDDPEAVQKLQIKIEKAEKLQQTMKEANQIIRKKITDKEKVKILVDRFSWMDELRAWKLLEPDFCGRVGFANYQLTNNSANIRRMKQRIESLKASEGQETTEKELDGFKVVENVEENRIQLIFPGKPSAEIRTVLKSHGFRWSPYNMTWQRHLNGSGRFAVDCVIKKLGGNNVSDSL